MTAARDSVTREHEERYDTLMQEHTQLKDENTRLEGRLRTMTGDISGSDAELRMMKVTALKTELRCANLQKAALEVKCSALETEVRELKSQQLGLETQITDKDWLITEVKTEKRALETQCAVRQEEVSGLKEKTSSLETTVTEVRRQADDLKVQNASQRAASDAKEKSMVDSHAADRARDDASHREFIAVQGAAHQAGAERVDQQSQRMMDQLIQQQDKERATQENAMTHVKDANAQVMDFMKLMFQQRNAPEIQQRSEPAVTSQEPTQDD